jgi:hypothetical protein
MKLKLTILFLFVFCYAKAQEDWSKSAKKDLEDLKTSFNSSEKKLREAQKTLDSIKTIYNPPTLVVEYDFQTGTYTTGKLKPKHNQPVVLKIININKFANLVEITNNDVKISNHLEPDEVEVKDALDNNKPSEVITTKTLDTEIPKSRIIVENTTKEANKIKKDLTTKLNDIKALKLNYSNKSLQESKDTIAFQNKIEGFEFAENVIQKQLDVFGNLTENFTKRTQKSLENYNTIQNCLIDINKINAAYDSYIDFVINPNLNKNQYNPDLSKTWVILDKEKRANYQSYIKTYEKAYQAFKTEYSDTFNGDLFYEIAKKDKIYADLVKLKFDNIKTEVESTNTIVNTSELRKKLSNVELIDHVLGQENAFEVVSNPIQPLEDYIEFKVKITPNKDLGNSIIKQQVPKDFTYTEYVKGGVRWDFSAGTVFDFGIKNQQYEVKEGLSTDSTPKPTYKIVENNTSQYTPTIAGLLHTSFRSNSMFAFGFSLGASIDLTSLNLNSFFPGISLLIGKKEKTIFTIGPAFKKVKQIKSIYDTNTTYDTSIQVTDITSEQFKIGWFVGISYNLTSKQKSKIKVVN